MKLRIKGNSVRFRLSISEVKQLVREEEVFESAHIMNETFVYGLKQDGGDAMQASFSQNRLVITIPRDQVAGWDKNKQIGFEHTTEQGLKLLVEKDFKCLIDRDEDESDLHNHPNEK